MPDVDYIGGQGLTNGGIKIEKSGSPPTEYADFSISKANLATISSMTDGDFIQVFTTASDLPKIITRANLGASVDLSAVAQNVVPSAADAYNLGSSTYPWYYVYASATFQHFAYFYAPGYSGYKAYITALATGELMIKSVPDSYPYYFRAGSWYQGP